MRGRATGQESRQRPLEVPHEQRVYNRVHGAVTVAQPSDGVEERGRHALAHGLDAQEKRF